MQALNINNPLAI
uniref:Uncharacterized protein n=1 Tax=Rhizophora mucronata TaxID=61149 RepID=A0A2P2LP77_RHIMU